MRERRLPDWVAGCDVVRAGLRLRTALRTRVDRIERSRAADVQSVSLLAAEAQIGYRLRYVDLPSSLPPEV